MNAWGSLQPAAFGRSPIPLEIAEITAAGDLERLRPEWACLWECAPAATPFQSPEWVLPWWRHLFGGGRLWTLTLRSEGRLAGLAPLFAWGEGCVSFLGAGVTDYLDILVEPGIEQEGTEMFLAHIAAQSAKWRVCDFQELRQGSPLLRSPIPAGLKADIEVCSVCPVVELPAAPRPKLRRARRRLQRSGELRFELASRDTLDEYLDAFFRLHAARWEARRETGVLASASLRHFHREVATGFLEDGALRFYGLRFDGAIKAVIYAFLSRGRVYAYLSGFDPALAQFSPGSLLLEFAMGSAARENAREFDFLREPESFKHQWGAKDRVNRRLLLRH